MNYLEAITIKMKPTLMKERRFDDIHVDQGWNVCSPHDYIINKLYLNFVYCIPCSINLMYLVSYVFLNLLNGFSTG